MLADGDWEGLREQTERLADSPVEAISLKARRMLALCLARSTERTDHQEAAAIYRDLDKNSIAQASDIAGLANVLIALGDYAAAKAAVLSGMAAFPGNADGFIAIGHRIVEATGDLPFRDRLSPSSVGGRTS